MKKKQSETDINLLRALEVFLAVSDARNVSLAATALGMTQSAVSKQIKKLEWALTTQLFNRSVRPIELTHAGEILRRRAFRVLNEVDDLRAEIRHVQASSIPILRVALLASIATSLTPGLLDMVKRDLGIPELSLLAGLSTDHQVALNNRSVHIAITSDPQFDLTDYDCIPILEEPFYLVLPGDFEGPATDIGDVSRQLSFARFSTEAPVGRRTDQHLQRCRLDLPRSMQADRASMFVAGVNSGGCFAILTPSLLIDAVVEGMNLRVEPPPFTGFKRSILAVARAGELDDILASVARESGRLLRQSIEKLLPKVVGDVIFQL